MVQQLKGWWDEIGPEIEKLAATGARIIDPLFDNKLALSEMIRKDPNKQQELFDLEVNNPGTLEQLYGKRIADKIKAVSTPSTKALTDKAGRGLANTPVEDIKNPTVAEKAYLSQSGAGTGLDVAQQQGTIAAQEQQLEFYKYTFDQLKWENAMKNVETKQTYDQIQAARAQNPMMALNDPYEMARDFLEGRMTAQQFSALKSLSPEGYEMTKIAIQEIGEKARMTAADNRADERLKAQLDREDRNDLNAARRQARLVAERTGLPFTELVKYFMGEEASTAVQQFFEEDQRVQESVATLKSIAAISPLMANYAKAEDEQKVVQKGILEGGLRAIFNAPVTIKSVPNKESFNPWDKKVIYILPFGEGEGEEINGQDLFDLANDPTLFAGMARDSEAVKGMNPARSKEELKALEEGRTAYITAYGEARFNKLHERLLQKSGGRSDERRRR